LLAGPGWRSVSLQQRLINHSKCSQELRLSAGLWITWLVQDFLILRASSKAAKSPDCADFSPPPPGLARSCCKHTHLFKIDPWVTPSFPQGDPIIFFDHPRVISATRAWHTPVATHQPQAEGSPPERLGGQQPGRSRPDRTANKIRRYIRIKCYSRELPMRRGSTLSGCKRPRHQWYLLQLSFSSI